MTTATRIHFAEGPNPTALCTEPGPVAAMTGEVSCPACLLIWELRRELFEARGELAGLRLAVEKSLRHAKWLRAQLDELEKRTGAESTRGALGRAATLKLETEAEFPGGRKR